MLKVLQALHLLGLQPTELLAPPIIRHLSTMVWPCETRTSPCRNFATTWESMIVIGEERVGIASGPYPEGRRRV
jgi:hypothetical protein